MPITCSGIQMRVSDALITTEETLASLNDPRHGAQILFSGVVRNSNLGRSVNGVSYDAFAPLATQILQEICAEAQAR